jgi:hypothetical protein
MKRLVVCVLMLTTGCHDNTPSPKITNKIIQSCEQYEFQITSIQVGTGKHARTYAQAQTLIHGEVYQSSFRLTGTWNLNDLKTIKRNVADILLTGTLGDRPWQTRKRVVLDRPCDADTLDKLSFAP